MVYKKICKYPFTHIEINHFGCVSFCCAQADKHIKIGNIFEQPFDEIWNGKKAQEIRKAIINNNYEYCNIEMCSGIEDHINYTIEQSSLIASYPKTINMTIDNSCDCRCIICRDKNKKLTKKQQELLKKRIDEIYIPILKNADIVLLDSDGEIFQSEYSKIFLKKAAETYPKLKFELLTNGILCDEKNLTELGIIDRIFGITVSLHAATKETYEKYVRGGDFNKVIENIKYLKNLEKQKVIEYISLTFCITPINFRELIDIVKFATKLKISICLTNFCNWGNDIELCKNFEKNDILNPNHPNHQELKSILQNSIFNSQYCLMNDVIRNVQEEY